MIDRMKSTSTLATMSALAASVIPAPILKTMTRGLLPKASSRRHYNKPVHNTPEIDTHNAKIEAKRREKLARKGKLK